MFFSSMFMGVVPISMINKKGRSVATPQRDTKTYSAALNPSIPSSNCDRYQTCWSVPTSPSARKAEPSWKLSGPVKRLSPPASSATNASTAAASSSAKAGPFTKPTVEVSGLLMSAQSGPTQMNCEDHEPSCADETALRYSGPQLKYGTPIQTSGAASQA